MGTLHIYKVILHPSSS